ncbi:MAG: DUF2330 domain-containing protein [Anaerolineae bacterium]|nr:DUF2330 domain-containing protein [Anaerolineae bacterium]
MSRNIFGTLVLLLIVIWPTEAIGGLFPATGRDYIDLRSLDITYAIDSETETITAYFQAQYAGANPEFLWLIPVPTNEVETEYLGGYASPDLTSFNLPYHNPPVIFDLPPNYCANMHSDLYNSGSGGSDLSYVPPEVVQTQVLTSDEVLGWLDEGDYDLPLQVRTRVEEYTAQGMYFVALELEGPAKSPWLTSITLKLTYPGDISRLTVPFGLFFNDEPVDVEMSILADVRYVPENFADVTVDRHEFRVDHAIGWVKDIPIRMNGARAYFSSRSNYLDLRRETIRQENGLAFITELAMPIDLLYEEMNKPYGESSLVEIRSNLSDYATGVGRNISDYHYLTQLFGLVGYTDNPDPVFVASSADSVVGNIIDATDVDPLAVWGCSTRTIENTGYEAIEPYLPSGRTSFYAHPEGWESYPIQDEEGNDRRGGMLIAPEPVSYQTLEAYWKGEPVPPMLLIDYKNYPIDRQYSTYDINFPAGAVLPRYGRNFPTFSIGVGGGNGIVIGLLTTEDDFAENEAMYRAMVDFPLTYQYRIHPELRHSLYLNPTQGSLYFPPSIIPAFSIGFPEGWIERMPIHQHVFIVPDPWNIPETFEDPSDVPYVWIRPADDFDENIPTARWEERISAAADYMVERFGVDRDDLMELQATPPCGNVDIFQPFEQDGRRGYVAISLQIREQPFLMEISAPVELYEQYEAEIENMLASAYPYHACG